MLVVGYAQLGADSQPTPLQDVRTAADQLYAQVPTTITYDRWDVQQARAAALALTHYYEQLSKLRTAEQTIIGPLGMQIPAGDKFTACDVAFCEDQGCLNLPDLCNAQSRLDLTNALGHYLAMWQADVTDSKVEQVIGPSRMLYYQALVNDPNDKVRERAAYWAGKIPVYDVRPFANEPDRYNSFTIEGLLTLALRNPPAGYSEMPSAASVMAALVALLEITDRRLPVQLRSYIIGAMERITGKAPFLLAPHEIPGPYSKTEKTNIFHAAQAVKAHMYGLPDPPPIPPAIPDPWLPTTEDIPAPQPYPPKPIVVSYRRARIAGASIGGMAVLAALGLIGYNWYQQRRARREEL
jgi:hypothetical protein